MSSDLVAFLRARLDETEQRAHLALQVIGGRWDSWEIVAQQLHACCNTVPGIGRAGQHLHHNADPRKVLADIAAKRRVIGEYEKALRSLPCDDRHGGHPAAHAAVHGRDLLRPPRLPREFDMNHAVEVELVGGPADGMRHVVQGDPMDPPVTIEVKQAPDWREIENLSPDELVPVRTLTYRRTPNPGNEGPLWHYRYNGD